MLNQKYIHSTSKASNVKTCKPLVFVVKYMSPKPIKDTEIKMKSNHPLFGPAIPKPATIFGWLLVLAGSLFAYVYMFNPGLSFPGVTIGTYSEQFGLYSTGVRILGSVLGITIALLLNSAMLLALMLTTRVFIELGDVVVGLVINHGAMDANTFTLTALAAIEVFFIIQLTRAFKAQ